MGNLIDNRHIRVFISSTFRDMQDERDYLINHTYPELRRIAAMRDVTLTEVDLRWGITEEESMSGKVVEICLHEIDNSTPFFIGIVGNRYGWVPSEKDIKDTPDMQDRYRWVYEDVNAGLSVTEMEMQYGVLRRETRTNAYFYIKENFVEKDADYPEKLETLRKSIKENGRYPVYCYRGVEDLAEAVKRDFIELLDAVFPIEESTPHEIERRKQHACISQLQQCYTGNAGAKEIEEFVADDCHDLLTVTGESGCGKSAFLANWIESRKEDKSHHYLYYLTNGQSEINPEYILKYWINELCILQGQPLPVFPDVISYQELKSKCEELITSSSRPVVIVFDDATTFINSDNWQLNTLDWMPSVHDGNKLIIANSLTKTSFSEHRKENDSISETHIELSTFEPSTVEAICAEYLGLYGKKLTKDQTRKIVEFKLSSNGRVLMTLLDELVNYGQFETLSPFIDKFTGAWTPENFYERYLKHVEGKYPEKLVEKFLSLVALSQNGIKENELKGLLGISPLLWSQIYCSFAKHFSLKNGTLIFASTDIYKAVLRKYRKKLPVYRLTLINYLEGKYKQEEKQEVRDIICDELAAQYFIQAEEYEYEDDMAERLYKLISQPEAIWYFIMKRSSRLVANNGEGRQSYKYWTWLYSHDSKKYRLATYIDEGKYKDEDFLVVSCDLVDIAFHAGDKVSVVLIACKALRLYRECKNVTEEIKQYFTTNISYLKVCAYSWISCLEPDLKELCDQYEKTQELPPLQTAAEKCMLTYAEAIAENDINKFEEVLSYLDSQEDKPIDNLATLYYRLAITCQEENLYEKALGHIESAQGYMDLLEDEYNDQAELFKAHLLGTKGLIYKDMHRLEEAYNAIYGTIIRYEDIEDLRIMHGDYRATIEYVEEWEEELGIIQEMIDNEE